MELGKVVGQVVATVRDPSMPHLTLLLVDVVDGQGRVMYSGQVAADTLGAGEGEIVLLARGSSARKILEKPVPVDLSVIGIVDQISSQGRSLYQK